MSQKVVSLGEAMRACYEGRLTQVELAEQLGRAQRTISSWVTGSREPSFNDVRNFEAACGRPLGWILTRAGFVSPATRPESIVVDSPTSDSELYVGAMPADETDELNPHPPPTTGLNVRHFRGADQAEMLRRVADYIDRANPGRTIVGMWCVPSSDYDPGTMELEIVFEHDEDAYEEEIVYE